MKKNIYIFLSSLCLIYFILLIFISFKHFLLNNFFGAMFELVTIPLILLSIILLAINFYVWHMEKMPIKSISFLSVLISITTIMLMSLATIFDI